MRELFFQSLNNFSIKQRYYVVRRNVWIRDEQIVH